MRTLKRISAIMLISLMLICLGSVNVFAVTVTQDGLEATLTTDKDTYGKNDKISARVTVKNTSSTDVENVVLEALVPDGYTRADNTQTLKTVGTLKAGETAKLDAVYVSKDNDSDNNNSGAKTTDSNTTNDKVVNTGDVIGIIVASVLILCGCGALIGFMLKNKKSQKILSLLLAVAVFGSMAVIYTPFNTLAIETSDKEIKSISLSQKINIDNKNFSLQANITYSTNNETSENIAEEYYKKNTKILSITKATDSKNVFTEQEVANLLSERGFDITTLITNCTIDGKSIEDTEIDGNSQEKHPLYKMAYGSDTDLLWTIYVVNGVVSAYPVSYNLVSERQAPLLITETDSVISYDYNSNQFFETIPKESTVIVRKVDRIDKETLDAMTIGGLAIL